MIPVGLAILCLFVLCVLNFCSMSLQEQADIQVCLSGHPHLLCTCLCSAGSFARVPGNQSGNSHEKFAAACRAPALKLSAGFMHLSEVHDTPGHSACQRRYCA